MKPNKHIIATLHENYVASELGGSVVGGSGCGTLKGDVSIESFLIECKATNKLSRTVSTKEVRKIRLQAREVQKNWALAIRTGAGDQDEREDLVVVDLKTFRTLLT